MSAEMLNPDICIRAYKARDARFDGRFFIGVKTTGVFCRPVCPAPSPKRDNVEFYPSAAAAASAGFRPCLRCRPEASPGTPAWQGSSATVARALRLIDEGALDDGNVTQLAARLDIGPRQLVRLFNKHLGASPVAIAQTRRLLFAKKLIDESRLSMADVAFASGFGSIRRFNDVFSRTYGRPPSSLRRKKLQTDVQLSLSYRPPYGWNGMLDFLSMRTVPGVEYVADGSYYRALCLDGSPAILAVRQSEGRNALLLSLLEGETRQLMKLAERCRRVFDLGADPGVINQHLRQDPLLAPLVDASPGLRLPGAWSLFEIVVRAILGQQVSVAAARTLAGRLVARCGETVGSFPDGSPACAFPTAAQIANADLDNLGLTRKRAETLHTVARTFADNTLTEQELVSADMLATKLESLPGIGPWTSQYIAMRGLSEPDALPLSDLGLLKATDMSVKQLDQHAQRWRPWRAYAAIHLWHSLSQSP